MTCAASAPLNVDHSADTSRQIRLASGGPFPPRAAGALFSVVSEGRGDKVSTAGDQRNNGNRRTGCAVRPTRQTRGGSLLYFCRQKREEGQNETCASRS
ncbi:hypothetical protein RSA36_03610 [Pantoea stewartii]|nr:hypothetical protein RSA30_16175 [Pantoea stewartii]KTT09006.1 hypothetical protein RSA36_03610 [Pantoea stewartii]